MLKPKLYEQLLTYLDIVYHEPNTIKVMLYLTMYMHVQDIQQIVINCILIVSDS